MMSDLEFDQLLESTLVTRGPQAAGDPISGRVMDEVRATRQRRPVVPALDRRAWPAAPGSLADPAVARSLRLVLISLLAIALMTGALLAGRGLADRLQPLPPELHGVLTTRVTLPALRPQLAPLELADGRLLLIGAGEDGSVALVVDLASGRTTPVQSPDRAFAPSMGAPLPDGTVLLVGTSGEDGVARILEPATLELGPGIAMFAAHRDGAVVSLDDGRVLVAGGYGSPAALTHASAEIFDPVTESFEPTGPMTIGRAGHAMLALDGGLVVVGGGSTTTDRWLSPGSPAELVSRHVLVVEIFDATRGVFTSVAELDPVRRDFLGSEPVPPLPLPDGRILVFRDREARYCGRDRVDPIQTQVLDPATWTLSPGFPIPHGITMAAMLDDGRVLVGGAWAYVDCEVDSEVVQDAWLGIHDPTTGGTLETLDPRTGATDLPFDTDRVYAAAVSLADGRVALVSDGGVYGYQSEVAPAQVIDVLE